MELFLLFLFSGSIVISVLILGVGWKKFKIFFHNDNYTYFDICFILTYFLEQFIFIFLSYFYEEYSKLFIGLFALIVLTTVTLQRVMMESRAKKISNLNSEYLYLNERYKDQIEILEKQNEELIEILSEDLDK